MPKTKKAERTRQAKSKPKSAQAQANFDKYNKKKK